MRRVLISGRFDCIELEERNYEFCNLIPGPNFVVANEESSKSDAGLESIKFLNQVIRDPKLLEGLSNFFKTHNTLDLVSSE
jgi:hypothetical protein